MKNNSRKKKRGVPLLAIILISVVAVVIIASAVLYVTGVFDRIFKAPEETAPVSDEIAEIVDDTLVEEYVEESSEEEIELPEFTEVTAYPEIDASMSDSLLDYKDLVGFVYCDHTTCYFQELDFYHPDGKYIFESEEINNEDSASWANIDGEIIRYNYDEEIEYYEYVYEIQSDFNPFFAGDQVYGAFYSEIVGQVNGYLEYAHYRVEYVVPGTLPSGLESRERAVVKFSLHSEGGTDFYSLCYDFENDSYEKIDGAMEVNEEQIQKCIQVAKKAKVRYMNLIKEGQAKAKGE